jgi:hypothetical protein
MCLKVDVSVFVFIVLNLKSEAKMVKEELVVFVTVYT